MTVGKYVWQPCILYPSECQIFAAYSLDTSLLPSDCQQLILIIYCCLDTLFTAYVKGFLVSWHFLTVLVLRLSKMNPEVYYTVCIL